MKTLAALFLSITIAAEAATPTVLFTLMDAQSNPVTYKQVAIVPSLTSFARAEGSSIAVRDHIYKMTDGNGQFYVTNMVPGTYTLSVTGRFVMTPIQYTIPDTNGVIQAVYHTTTGTNSPSNLAAYSITAANARFIVNSNGFGTNTTLKDPVLLGGTAASGRVWTATNSSGLGEWRVASGGGNGITAGYTNNVEAGTSLTEWEATNGINSVAFARKVGDRLVVGWNVDFTTLSNAINQRQYGDSVLSNFVARAGTNFHHIRVTNDIYAESSVLIPTMDADSVVITDSNKRLTTGAVTAQAFSYIANLSADAETRLDNLDGSTNALNALVRTKQHGSAVLTNISGTGALTNITSANSAFTPLLNASNQPVVKTISASGAVEITDNVTNIVIGASAASGEANTASSLGNQWSVVAGKSGVDLRFNTLTNGNGLTSSSNNNVITFSLSGDATNGMNTRIGNLEGATNGMTTRLDNLDGSTNALDALVRTKQHGSAILTNLSGTGAITNAPWTNSYQPASLTLTNLSGTRAITNASDGWGTDAQIASDVLTVVKSNAITTIATNATGFILDFGNTTGTPMYRHLGRVATNLTATVSNLVSGRTIQFIFIGATNNGPVYTVTIATNGLTSQTAIRWNKNSPTNGATSFSLTNGWFVKGFLTHEGSWDSTEQISGEFGFYQQ